MFWSKKTIWNPGTILTTVAILSVIDIGNVKAGFIVGEPVNLTIVNSEHADWGPSISSDGLELYFGSARPGGSGDWDLWVSTRTTTEDEWGAPVNLGSTVNSPVEEGEASISADGLELYFASNRSGGSGGQDLWVSKRATADEPWGTPENLGSIVNSSYNERYPSVSADGLELYFNCNRDWGLYVTRRATKDEPWGAPVVVPGYMIWPNISSDGSVLLFGADQAGGYGDNDIWMKRRATTEDDWGPSINLGPTVNGPYWDCEPSLSHDGRTLYFTSGRYGGVGNWDTWQVSIELVVDFNGDGKVDLKDFSKLAQHWAQNETSCDIAPPPLGDSMVDIKDVATLAECWLQEIGLIGHWKLDETEGSIAYDSAGDHDATVHGDAVWQPSAGQIDGALEFDGVDDYVETDFVLNPGQGPLSVFLWVKGEVPGQVILSQVGGVNWFYTLGPMGWLMTNLGQHGAALLSQTVITDGQWHRIGFTWDWTNRTLYVDGVEVARDTQSGLAGSDGGLYFGAGKELESDSFFSGLIDDVKIYIRAIVP